MNDMAHSSDARTQCAAYLQQNETKDLLRFITCGSVDDGKSTLIGRLLHDTKLLLDDQVAALEADSRKHGTQGDDIDFALLVDGLAAEREQGITIDVAYRFFGTEKRKFIVADCPGPEQYTRNMATGASTADLAIVLVDARKRSDGRRVGEECVRTCKLWCSPFSFKQKTAYEMRISDWSSDVCSSDLKHGTQGDDIDFALLVDGLAAEREQGITIDVAYRFFGTEKRKFIVADCPGHEQYTRNMATGASTADLAIVLVDARKGLLTQTRRHSYIVSLLGIRHVVLAVNKMDLVDYDQTVFDDIARSEEHTSELQSLMRT